MVFNTKDLYIYGLPLINLPLHIKKVNCHMPFLRTICFILIFINTSIWSFGQNRILRGRVVDESGQPVAFASITFNGYSYGTNTDKNGNYIALISESYDSIVCTHVNYKSKSEKIEGNAIINLVLEKQATSS